MRSSRVGSWTRTKYEHARQLDFLSETNGKQLLDSIEDEIREGGYIIDWHACDLFPKSWIDLVVVLRVDSTVLHDRLTER